MSAGLFAFYGILHLYPLFGPVGFIKYHLFFLNFQHPLVYENAVQPAPLPEDWFHSTIVVQKDSIIVYVDHSAVPSLRVRRFDLPAVSGIGLLTDGLSGDFANLVLKEASSDK